MKPQIRILWRDLTSPQASLLLAVLFTVAAGGAVLNGRWWTVAIDGSLAAILASAYVSGRRDRVIELRRAEVRSIVNHYHRMGGGD